MPASRTALVVNKAIYQMSVASLIGVVIWVGYSVYQALMVPPKVELEPQLLEPISGELSREVLESVANRQQLSNNVNDLFLALPEETPTASPSN